MQTYSSQSPLLKPLIPLQHGKKGVWKIMISPRILLILGAQEILALVFLVFYCLGIYLFIYLLCIHIALNSGTSIFLLFLQKTNSNTYF